METLVMGVDNDARIGTEILYIQDLTVGTEEIAQQGGHLFCM